MIIVKYVVYATTKDGNGYVEEIGRFNSVEEIRIRVGMFADDVVIEIKEEVKDEN